MLHRGQKLLVYDKRTCAKISAYVLSDTKIAVGADVWRMGNRIDICEYPFSILSRREFFENYKIDNERNSLKPWTPRKIYYFDEHGNPESPGIDIAEEVGCLL